MENKTLNFIKKAKEIHGDKYDYSKTEYINSGTKVCIICPKHGEFWQRAYYHLKSVGCPECGKEKAFIENKRRGTLEEFIKKAKEIHNNKYDYSKVEYINNHTKICIICPEHGEFWQTPCNHLSKKGCPKCRNEKVKNVRRKDKNTFINDARKVHGDKYDYSKVEYINSNTKICIICPKHGEFWQAPNSHLQNVGCPKCAKTGVKLTNEEFITRIKEIHGNRYDYSKVNYINAKTKVCIICPDHGEFWQIPSSHLAGQNCPRCMKKIVTEDDFFLRSKEIHGDKYDYSKVKYINCSIKVCIICPKHGEFWQTPNKHMSGQGCPSCKQSKLEEYVCKILNKYEINYEQEKKFDWLKLTQPLRLDFYLPDYNIAIECQGKQHFFENCTFTYSDNKESLEIVQLRDKTKYQLCKEHGINILYFTFEKVNDSKLIKSETKLITEILKYKK